MREAKRRMDEELWVEQRANAAAYEAWRTHGRQGRSVKVTPYRPPDQPAGQINLTDPDSRIVQGFRHGFIQGYTAQAVKQPRSRS